MMCNSYLKCGISNKMDGTKDDALYEDFLCEGVAETDYLVDNDSYADYYDNSPVTHDFMDYGWVSFFADDKNVLDFEKF